MRAGGVRAINLGSGSFNTKGLVVPQTLQFGFAMFGDDWNSCNLFCDVAIPDTVPGIDLRCEFARFKNIRFIGSSADNIVDNALRCNIIRSKLTDMRADCDVSAQGCFFVSARSCIQLYGRGLLVDGCAFNGCINAVEIVSDPTQFWPSGADQGNGPKSGMRNYRISNIRTDGATYVLAVSGTGVQKDYINGVIMQGLDLYSNGSLINIPDATLRNLVVDGVAGQEACPFGLVVGKSINGAVFSNLAISKSISRDEVITGVNPTMQGLMNMTGSLDNITFNNCDFGPIRSKFITVGAESSNIIMTNINLHRLFSASAEPAVNVVLVGGANVKGFRGSNWNITGPGPGAGKNVLACVLAIQTSNRFSLTSINANFEIKNTPLRRIPSVLFGANQVTPLLAVLDIEYQGQFVQINGAVNVPANGMGANLALSITTGLQLTAMIGPQTSGVSGGGVAYYYVESPDTTSYPIPVHARVTAGGTIQFFKASNGQILTSTDIGINSTVHAIQFSVRCKVDPVNFV